MVATRIADVFQIRTRFMRSIHLERDFSDEAAVRGYVLTPHARAGMERLAEGLLPTSTQRAWRITGDFGTGKSSFALALGHLLSGKTEGLPLSIKQAIDFRRLGTDRPQLLPVLVTGARTRMSSAILKSLEKAMEGAATRGKKPRLLERIRNAAAAETSTIPDADILTLLADTVRYVCESGRGSGVLVILDELGKFLEYAALHPGEQDIYFLQTLAEAAARSGPQPLFVVGLLHQGFNAYAEQLSQVAQKEWEKVAGRFGEILFNQPLEQMAGLVADALNVRLPRLPPALVAHAERDMARAVDLGWFGGSAVRQTLVTYAPRLFPLHPTVLPALIRLFSRFGQNERSLFSFLLSDEPFSLQEFAVAPLSAGGFYRISHLYDYARSAFGHRLSVQSYRSHWNQIESVVESFPRDDAVALQVLKTVAVLNLLDAPGLLAIDDTIALAVLDAAEGTLPGQMKQLLKRLQRDRAVLYFRGASGGYCLWPHTSVNLERAYQDASRSLPPPARVGPLLSESLETRPLVARRHYIETGNLRHFTVTYPPPSELTQAVSAGGEADGRIVVAICETEEERREALRAARSETFRDRADVLVAVPRPLQGLANLLQEVQRWEWISHNVPELNHDTYAMEEVTRQLKAARQVLEKQIRNYVGLRQFAQTMDLQWFHAGRPLTIRSGRDLLTKLSVVCDEFYAQAPRLKNELVNRHALSSAAAAARMRLIERVFRFPSSPFLGIDPATKPPEMSMYLSVFQAAGLHQEQEGRWTLTVPPEGADPCHVRPVFERMRQFLEERPDVRVKIPELFQSLRRPPYGIRDGLCPLLLAVFAALHEQDVAFYEDGRFVRLMGGQELHRLIKAPEMFEIQYCHIGGVRAVVFERLYQLLNPEAAQAERPNVLDVVRPLCVFAAQLPEYTHKTAQLSPEAVAVRQALLRAEEPATLIFRHLPEACGLTPFTDGQSPSPGRVKRFVERLQGTLDELRAAYPILLERLAATVTSAFDRPGNFGQVREGLAGAASGILVAVADPRLKAFCLRLADRGLEEQRWLESLGSFVCAKPPGKWVDTDAAFFTEELHRLAGLFRRVEATVFATFSGNRSSAIRVAITCQDGAEADQVIYLEGEEEKRALEIEERIASILQVEKRVGLAAATRALWRHLNAPEKGAGQRR